jgi:hypothetical protein
VKIKHHDTLHRVLNWGSCEEKTVSTMKTEEGLPPDTGRIFDILSFIEYHVLPFNTLKILLVLNNLESPGELFGHHAPKLYAPVDSL